MKKIAAFNYIFQKSLFSIGYYRDVVKARFGLSMKYFLFFSLFLGALMTISLSLFVLPNINKFTTRFKNRAYSLYPQDLIITLKNGELETNVAEPLRFPIPFELFTDNPPAISDQKQAYLLTIDTQASSSAYENSQSWILLTRHESVMANSEGGYRVDSLKNMADISINKQFVDHWLGKILPILDFAPIIIALIFACIFIILLPASRLVSLLFLSGFLLVAAKIINLNLGYKKIYQVGLHALTLPTLIQLIMFSFGLSSPIPFFYSIMYLLYAMVILTDLKKSTPDGIK